VFVFSSSSSESATTAEALIGSYLEPGPTPSRFFALLYTDEPGLELFVLLSIWVLSVDFGTAVVVVVLLPLG
jgi:hypothetical protein